MKIHEYVDGKVLGISSAHPDDHIPHAHLLGVASDLNVRTHEIVNTKGRNAGDNFRAHERPRFSVEHGDREKEGRTSAEYLGIDSYVQYDAEDGGLSHREAALGQIVAAWAKKNGVNVLASLATGDHPDHDAAVRSGRLAAASLLEEGYELDLLELQARGSADQASVWVEATPDSMARAFGAAKKNGSQFEMSDDIHGGWPIVPGGFTMEPRSLERLGQYPVLEDAAYRFIPAGQLVVAQSALITSGVR